MKKGDRVAFVARGVRHVGKVVRVKRDGMVTVDTDDMWWDIHPRHLESL